MGGLCATPKTEEDRMIEQKMQKDQLTDKKTKKLLFLGAGGSGKSTLFKQLKVIHGGSKRKGERSLSAEELDSYKATVHQNIMIGMKDLCAGALDEWEGKVKNVDLAEELAETDVNQEVTQEMANKIRTLWDNDAGIQEAWKIRGRLQVQDTLKYFIKNLDRITHPDYTPTTADVLHARSRTTGIVEQEFMIKAHPFLVVDVGGQRNERKKWIHSFDSVTAVIFVAALSAYDQTLYEDEDTNRMQESLKVFKEILTLKTFANTDVILFMNKADLFDEKMKAGSPITEAFPEYQRETTFEVGSQEDIRHAFGYIKKKFLAQNPNKQRNIIVHKTCATDTKLVEQIFNDVQRIIIDKALKDMGLA